VNGTTLTPPRLLSESGKSYAFDSRGTGFGRGEGCGMLVLKPLDQAVQDNDVIHAVVAGTGLNQDGKTPGITTPSGEAQGSFFGTAGRREPNTLLTL